MSTQLQEIHNDNASATAALKEPEVQTDSEMQTQTPQEEPKQIAGQDNRNDQKPTSQLPDEHGEVSQEDSPREPEVQTDSGIKSQTPQEEHHELLAGQEDLNNQTTSQLQEERREVTQPDSPREPEVQTDSKMQTQTPQEEPYEQSAGQQVLNNQKPTSQLQEERREVTQPDSPREPDVQADYRIKPQTPQEEHRELLAGQDDLNIQKPTSQLQGERGEVTQQDSPRDVQTDSEIQTPKEGHHEPSAGQEVLNIQIQAERGEVTEEDSPRALSTKDETVSTLLQEIEKNSPKAADKLNKLGIQTDSEIKSPTPEDLNEKPKDQLLEKTEGVTQQDYLIECLRKITYVKKKLDEALTEVQVNMPENFRKRLDFEKDPHFQTDSVIQTLTREDLEKLFPGPNNFNLRKTMFEILHNLSNDLLLGESGDVTQQDSAEGYSSNSSAPMTTNEKHNKKKGGDRSSSWWPPQNWFRSSQKPSVTVKYKMVVSGQPFDAHLQLLDQIKTPGLNLIKGNDEESCITIVFCPVASRTGTDAEAAMKKVPGDVPVILVLMHHSQEPKHVSSSKVLTSYSNVVLEVNVFYHNRKNGLLACEQNRNAVIELRKTLNNHREQSPESNKKGSK